MDIQQNDTPALRFPPFTEGWVRKKLGEVLTIGSGKDYKHLGKGNIPVFGTGGLMTTVDNYLYDGETVCIGRKGTIDKPMYFHGKIWTVDTLFYTHSFINSSPKFVFNLFQRINWKEHNEASGVPSLSKSTIEQIQLNLPTLPEQQKIAAFFTAIDAKLQQLKEKKRLLEAYKKGVMQQLFSQAIRFKNTEGGNFEDWEVRRLGELTYKTDKKNKENISYPVYSINNKEGFLPQSDQFEGVDSHDRGYDVSLYKIIQSNTFAYNPARIDVGSIGFSGDLNDIIISSLYVCFKTKDELNDDFLMIYLKSDEFNKAVLRKTEGGVRKYLFYENFSDIEIPIPYLAEQTQIANFLSAIDEKIKNTEGVIGQMAVWKKGLLQQMFV